MKDGENIEYYDSGEIQSIINYLDGNLHGEHIDYYTSGEISYKCNYINGKLYGEFIHYCESGEVYSKYYYICDIFVTELEWIVYTRNIKFGLLGL